MTCGIPQQFASRHFACHSNLTRLLLSSLPMIFRIKYLWPKLCSLFVCLLVCFLLHVILYFHVCYLRQNGDTVAIQNELELGADVEMATISGTSPLKPIFIAFLHDHNQVK